MLLIAFVDELVLEWRGRGAGGRPTKRCTMNDALVTTLLIVALFALLGSGVWIGLALAGVAWIGMTLFSSRPAGDAMAVTIWGTASSWTLTALPLFVWMGEILFRTRLSEDMFKGLAPWLERVPGRLLHTNIIGCTIFAAVSGSSAATCATIGKMTLPELRQRGYPETITIGTLAGAGTLGLLIPPSIIMIVYGVTPTCRSRNCSSPASCPASCWRCCFRATSSPGRCFTRTAIPAATERTTFAQKLYASRHLIPVVLLIVSCWDRSTPASRRRPKPPRSVSSARWWFRPRSARSAGKRFAIACSAPRGCTA